MGGLVGPDEQRSVDVAVLGGGIVGACAAYELAVSGVSVALIDASFPGRASDAGAGIASPETFADPDDEWFSFGLASADHLRSLVDRIEEDGAAPGHETFAECGSLVLALAEHEDPWFAEVAGLACARSSDVVEVPVEEARTRFPLLGSPWRALYSPRAGRIDGRGLCRAVLDAAGRRGVRLASTEAVGLKRRGDRVDAVLGTDREIPCGALVVATGAWTARTAEWLHVDVPVTPTKGQIVHVRATSADAASGGGGDSATWPIVQPVLNFYLVPWPGRRVACGGTFEPEAGFDQRPTVGGLRDLLRECLVIAPGLTDAELVDVRVGLRPSTPDDRPLLGSLPGASNVSVCTGHGANGLLMGPYSAALVAHGIVNETLAAAVPYPIARLAHASD